MQIDYTVHVSDLFLVGGGIVTVVMGAIGQRDINRKLLRILLGGDGDEGLVSGVKRLKTDMYESGGKVSGINHTVNNLDNRVGILSHHVRGGKN